MGWRRVGVVLALIGLIDGDRSSGRASRVDGAAGGWLRGRKVVVEMTLEGKDVLDGCDAVELEIGQELSFHLVQLADGEEILSDDDPGCVGVGVIAERLARGHESRKPQPSTARSLGRGEAGLESR